MKISKIKPHFGVDIDADATKFRNKDRETLVSLIAEYKVLRFRNQSFTADKLLRFSEILGQCWGSDDDGLIGNNEDRFCHPDNNRVVIVSNKKKGVLQDIEVDWHCDVSHRPWQRPGGTCPARALYAHKLPKDTTTPTYWIDLEWLYDHCPKELRDDLEHRNAVYRAPYKTAWDHCERSLVLVDPVTGRKSLSVEKVFFKEIEGYSQEDFLKVKSQLLKLATKEENLIVNDWRKGDLIVSNNYNTAHRRPAFVTKGERTLWRTSFQIEDLIPFSIRA